MPPKRAAESEDTSSNLQQFKKRLSGYAAGTVAPVAPSSTGADAEPTEDVIKAEEADPIVTKNSLIWFRNDLRLKDNTALYAASMRSRVGNKYLIGLYILSEEEWSDHDEAPVKIDFWMRNLTSLKHSLDKLAIPLIVKRATHKADVAGIVETVVREMEISHVFWNAELMINEQRRDATVRKVLSRLPNVHVEECDDQCVVPPRDIRTKTGNPYAVFTPFYNSWCNLVETEPHYLELSEAPDANPANAKELFAEHFKKNPPASHPHPLDDALIRRLYPAGEQEAHDRLHKFVRERATKYHQGRDSPHQEATSVLSPYLNAGVISTRQCIAVARAANKNKITTGDDGLKTWIKELGWREFYRHILVNFPRVCMSRAFQRKTERVQWSDNEELFERWCEGKTGFPIVDAVKDLLINWQWGEKYFMNNLIDGDLASNNGGWQWSASTGTDAQPYFRVFNPLLQSQRFDPKGEYIRRWVPELRQLSDKQIHEPYRALSPKEFAKLGYPKPIVDHAVSKKRYMDEFKRVLALG
ncbi:hypothetical protein EC968_000518 [Mortierella alpina]|nr:hypothetical protein EC968_000518 [Mortierella alpina]